MTPTNAARMPLDDICDLSEALLREATLARTGMNYARRTKKGRIKSMPAGTPEHLQGVVRYLGALADKADSVLYQDGWA